MITIDVETVTETVSSAVVGHSSRGPIGTKRIELAEHDAVVLKLTTAQAVRLIARLAERIERQEEGA
jgi:hypothetical protein